MKKAVSRGLLMAAVICGSMGMVWEAYAAGASTDEKLSEYDLEQIVVTATRTEEKVFKTKADITVITREELEKQGYQSVQEAIRRVPGVNIMSYTPSDNYTSNGIYINGTSNITYLVDGMRANTNGSIFNKAPLGEFVNMNNIERIEVLKGSASTLYGSDAQGGVINIITRAPEEDTIKTTLGVTGGSYHFRQFNFSNTGASNGYGWNINVQKRLMADFKDGWDHKVVSHTDSNDLGLKLSKKLSDYGTVTVRYNKYQNDYQRPGQGSLDPDRQYGEKNNSKVSFIYDQKINNYLTNKFCTFRNKSLLKDNIYKSLWYMDLVTEGLSDQLIYATKDNTLIIGYDFYRDKVDKYESTSMGQTTGYTNRSLSNKAIFIQDEFKFGKGFTFTPGIRFDNHNLYGHHKTTNLVFGYDVNDKTNLYIGRKEFFVAPNQFQIFSAYGSKDLKPEEGKTWEFGIKQKFDPTFNGTIRFYKQNAENLISYRYISGPPYIQYYNSDGVTYSKGFDISLNKRFSDCFGMNVSYSYLNMKARSEKEYRNDNGRLPISTWNIGLDYSRSKLDASFNGRGVIGRTGNKSIASVVDHDHYVTYWVFDLGMNYRPTSDLRIFARVNNLFDKYYSEYGTAGYTTIKNWYSMPGRNFQLGVEYTF